MYFFYLTSWAVSEKISITKGTPSKNVFVKDPDLKCLVWDRLTLVRPVTVTLSENSTRNEQRGFNTHLGFRLLFFSNHGICRYISMFISVFRRNPQVSFREVVKTTKTVSRARGSVKGIVSYIFLWNSPSSSFSFKQYQNSTWLSYRSLQQDMKRLRFSSLTEAWCVPITYRRIRRTRCGHGWTRLPFLSFHRSSVSFVDMGMLNHSVLTYLRVSSLILLLSLERTHVSRWIPPDLGLLVS